MFLEGKHCKVTSFLKESLILRRFNFIMLPTSQLAAPYLI